MPVKEVAVAVLLVAGVAVQALSSVGVWRMPDVYSRLHYQAAASTFGPVLIAAAIILREKLDDIGLKSLLIATLVLLGGGVLTHATGRAAHIREHEGWEIRPE